MQKIQLYAIVVTSLFVGNLLPRQSWGREAEAAPSDVFGSPNVAVDTYRNTHGTFVLWSDGRITNAETGQTENGNGDYSPGTSADPPFQDPVLENNRPLGSPNVAIKAVPRHDATYVLFSDGKFRKPNDADAAGNSWAKTVVLMTSGVTPFGSAAAWGKDPEEVESITSEGGSAPTYMITLKRPMKNPQLYGHISVTSPSGSFIQGVGLQRVDDTHYRLTSAVFVPGGSYSIHCFLVAR
jgi:hypothetical protein